MMEFSATIQTHNKNIMEPPLLPPGFRFHPLDHELLEHYLARKIVDANFTVLYIGDVDLNRCEPWDLPEMAKMGEKEWYFFALRDRKYPTGKRTNRATEAGYWKATGKDKEVMSSRSLSLLGMKKTLVFYKGRAPRGEKTNWIMHEYRSLESDHCHASNSPKDSEWVICRIYKKTPGGKKVHIKDMETSNIYNESEALNTLPPLESSHPTAGKDPGFDSDGSQQDDHVTKFARQDYQNALYSNGFRSNQSDFWEPSLQSGSFAPNEFVSDHLNVPNMRPYSYEDFYISNQQFSEGCLAVNNTGKMKQGPLSVLAPPFFSHAFDPSPSKGSDQISNAAIDYRMISRQCKAEPHDNVRVSEDPIRSSHSINMDNNLLSDNIVCLDIAHAKDLSVAEINAPYNLFQSTTSSWWI